MLKRAILPVDPLDGMSRAVRAHCFADRREEGLFAEAREEPEALQLVLDRVFHLGEKQLDAGGCSVSSSSQTTSAAVTSTLVTGSAATTSQ